MYFPDPTRKPTAKDYAWAREISAGDLGLRIEWALRHVAMRGVWEKDFCEGAGVHPTYTNLLRKKVQQHSTVLRTKEWEKFIAHIEKTEKQVPACLWLHQDLFPYHPDKFSVASLYMSQAGFDLNTLRTAMSERSGQTFAYLPNIKTPTHLQWQLGLTIVLEKLADNPLPELAPARMFPYDPKKHPKLAASQMTRIWRMQEAAGLDEVELSRQFDHYDGCGEASPYMRIIKMHGRFLPVDEYAEMVRILFKPQTLALVGQFSEDYLKFFPYSQSAREKLMLRTARLGMTYGQIQEASRVLFDESEAFVDGHTRSLLSGIIQCPSQKTWRKLVLSCQEVEKQMYEDFMYSWDVHYGENGEYSHLINGSIPEKVFAEIIRQGEKIDPVPAAYLPLFIDSGITLGGRIGKSYDFAETGDFPSTARVVDIVRPLDIRLADGTVEKLFPPQPGKGDGRLRIIANTGEDGHYGPIRIARGPGELLTFGAQVDGCTMGHAGVRRVVGNKVGVNL